MDYYNPGQLGPLEPSRDLLAIQEQLAIRAQASQQFAKADFALKVLSLPECESNQDIKKIAANVCRNYLEKQ